VTVLTPSLRGLYGERRGVLKLVNRAAIAPMELIKSLDVEAPPRGRG
jgi:hypothetical protein